MLGGGGSPLNWGVFTPLGGCTVYTVHISLTNTLQTPEGILNKNSSTSDIFIWIFSFHLVNKADAKYFIIILETNF